MSITINSAYGMNIAADTKNKLYVPVNPASFIYSHFDHVSGVIAKKGQTGVSISKIQILNTIIDQLTSIKAGNIKPVTSNPSPEEIDALIENYQTQIRQAVKTAQTEPYILAGNRPEAGVLFTISA